MTILTPKGYSSARQPSSERPEEPAPPAADERPEEPQPAPSRRPGQIQLTFPPQVVGVNCPNCGTPYPAQVFSIVDVGQDPILKNMLLSGELNVAICPRCGSGGTIATPLLYHDPEHDFLGVYVPEQVSVAEQQQVIGQLSRRLMDRLPAEARRGYMLTPRQFLNYQGLLEAILEHEGITPEMLEQQRRRLSLLEQALATLKDPEGLRLLAAERDADMDDEFFGMMQMLTEVGVSSGDQERARQLLDLREKLIELTKWGEQVKKQRAAIAQLRPETTSSQLADMVMAADDRRVVDALVTAGRPLVNYAFYQHIASSIEAAERQGNQEEATRLQALRQQILEISQRLDQLQQAILQQASRVLQEILASNDIVQAVVEHASYVDQNFLSVLAANLQQAERQGATAAVRRLQEVWDAAFELIQEDAPPEFRLINELLNADYPGETRKMLKENREMITPDLIESMAELADQLEAEGNGDVAARLRQIRSQAQLMG